MNEDKSKVLNVNQSKEQKNTRATRKHVFIYLTIVTLAISLIPMPVAVQSKISGWDKLIHSSIYCILGFFGQSVLSLITLLWGGLLALLTELLQKFIPGRAPEITDFSANILGLIIGTSFWELVKKRG